MTKVKIDVKKDTSVEELYYAEDGEMFIASFSKENDRLIIRTDLEATDNIGATIINISNGKLVYTQTFSTWNRTIDFYKHHSLKKVKSISLEV